MFKNILNNCFFWVIEMICMAWEWNLKEIALIDISLEWQYIFRTYTTFAEIFSILNEKTACMFIILI